MVQQEVTPVSQSTLPIEPAPDLDALLSSLVAPKGSAAGDASFDSLLSQITDLENSSLAKPTAGLVSIEIKHLNILETALDTLLDDLITIEKGKMVKSDGKYMLMSSLNIIDQTNMLQKDISKTILELQASVSNMGDTTKQTEKSFVRAKPLATATKPLSEIIPPFVQKSEPIKIEKETPTPTKPVAETKPVLQSVSGLYFVIAL